MEAKRALAPDYCPNCGSSEIITATSPESLEFEVQCEECGAEYVITVCE